MSAHARVLTVLVVFLLSALPVSAQMTSGAIAGRVTDAQGLAVPDRKSTRLNSSHGYISYAVFCLKKKNPPARICTLMARIEAGELGEKGRERELLSRALRAPRDRAWIADSHVSDLQLPVSSVTCS